MGEQQDVEYKISWRDECLKWVCGFANANGGALLIGKNDDGQTLGVDDPKKLLEDLPNKIRDILGVMAEVKLKKDAEGRYIEILVPAYSVPISFRGRYYFRSGATNQELAGNALNEFLLRKAGRTWDEIVEHQARLLDIDIKSIESFLDAARKTGRFPGGEKLPLRSLLDKLRLLEKGKVRRAAVILIR